MPNQHQPELFILPPRVTPPGPVSPNSHRAPGLGYPMEPQVCILAQPPRQSLRPRQQGNHILGRDKSKCFLKRIEIVRYCWYSSIVRNIPICVVVAVVVHVVHPKTNTTRTTTQPNNNIVFFCESLSSTTIEHSALSLSVSAFAVHCIRMTSSSSLVQ